MTEYLPWMLDAYNFRPSRAEPLTDLATHFREQGKNALACLFAEAAMGIEPSKDSLFVERHAYAWGPRREFAISAFYDHRKRPRGYEVCDSLITDADAPDHVRTEARSNMFFYLQPLSSFCKSFKAEQVGWARVKLTGPQWPMTNPSVTRFGRLTLMCLRTVNYRIREDGSYDMQGDDAIRTRNFLLTLNAKQDVLDAKEIVWERPPAAFGLVLGLEDMRIFQNDDRLMFIACTREQDPQGFAEQVVGEIDHTSGRIISFRTVHVEPKAHEKNWMPIAFTYSPMKFVYRPDRIINEYGETIMQFEGMKGVEHFSGGTPLIDFNSGFLALVHESWIKPGHTKRFYQHRFCWFDNKYKLSKWSLPFFFNEKGIEFAAGIARCPYTGNLLISYGVDDAAAFVASVDPMEVGFLLWHH